jgi:hypothetical protein
MKKSTTVFLLLCALCACGGMVKSESGADALVQLDGEPVGCQYLYKLESETSVYDSADARRYLENRIADQARRGNAYWVTSQRTRPNEWVLFGPERTYILAANVYRCPDSPHIATIAKGDAASFGGGKDSAYMYGKTY